ncbi:MAG: phosphatidate cytidylyltransferase [Thermococci archaeon]|nr:phosphatidate cytidylyltransferase [Thermococci archaeon]
MTSLKNEAKRKALHLTGLSIPAVYILFGRDVALTYVAVFLAVFIALEPLRIVESLREEIKRRLKLIKEDAAVTVENLERKVRNIERESEHSGIAAHIYFTLAALIIVYFFSKNIAIGAISVATLGDSMAAIVGRAFGRHRFSNGKSLEGSLAYFITALVILIPLFQLPLALLAALVGTLTEFHELPPDDNFSNQLMIALVLYIW